MPPRPPRPPSFPSPPPAEFPYVMGSFDFPHASTSPGTGLHSPADGATEQPGFTERAAADQAEQAARRSRSARRGQLHRIFGPPRDSDSVDHLSRRPSTANPNRPRATPSERYLRRSQARIRELREANMDSATEPIDSLSHFGMTNPFYRTDAHSRPRSPIVEINSERRNKRRKLDHGMSATGEYTCYKYGYKGQVVPGRLRMEIVSCDGGEHRKDNPPGLYRVQNVLKNDKSVYCSESSECNLLLKHIGEAAFTLERIVIRAPDRGFTAPVQEGLVFISMSADELLPGTSAYNLSYGTRSPLMSPTPSSPDGNDEQLSFREAMEDPLVWQRYRQQTRVESHSLRTQAESPNLISSMRSDRERRNILRQMVEHEDEVDGEHCDNAADEPYTGVAGVSAPTPPPFTVTTASEEEESDSNEELPSAAVMADRMRRESRWRPESDPEDEEAEPRLRRAPALGYSSYEEWREQRQHEIEPIRASRVAVPSRIESFDPGPAARNSIPPHARFFIAKNKNKITIKFHPAISGKHALLKFWSPKHDGNIDIESVQFYGYSGPRFFPAMQPR